MNATHILLSDARFHNSLVTVLSIKGAPKGQDRQSVQIEEDSSGFPKLEMNTVLSTNIPPVVVNVGDEITWKGHKWAVKVYQTPTGGTTYLALQPFGS